MPTKERLKRERQKNARPWEGGYRVLIDIVREVLKLKPLPPETSWHVGADNATNNNT